VVTYEDLVSSCADKGIDALAVMDHDVIEGAFEFRRRSEESRARGDWAPEILIGEEVRTTKGEICGLFLSEWVPDHLPPRRTMEIIKGQGGLVYIPHPFDLLKMKRLKASDLVELSDLIDVIEVFNGKPRFPMANVLARRFVRKHPFKVAAGSDAHDPTRIGAAFVEMEPFEGPQDFPDKLDRGAITGKMYCPFASAYTRFKMRHLRRSAD
jgi:hypothetical protein